MFKKSTRNSSQHSGLSSSEEEEIIQPPEVITQEECEEATLGKSKKTGSSANITRRKSKMKQGRKQKA